MGFILTVIQPPKGDAKEGETTVSDPIPDQGKLFTAVYWAFRNHDGWLHPEVANKYAGQVTSQGVGREVVETSTGLRFRIDLADDAQQANSAHT